MWQVPKAIYTVRRWITRPHHTLVQFWKTPGQYLIEAFRIVPTCKVNLTSILGEMTGVCISNVTWIFVTTFAHFVLLDSRRKVDLENILKDIKAKKIIRALIAMQNSWIRVDSPDIWVHMTMLEGRLMKKFLCTETLPIDMFYMI